jgi:CBS domain-containing protein
MQSDIVYVSVPGTREDVLQIMAEQEIMGLPVVKKGTKKLVGIVTRTDLLQKADENQLALLMIRDPKTVTPRSEVKTAARIMLENDFRRLPVVDKDELVGLITIADILSAVLEGKEKFEEMDIRDFVRTQVNAIWEQTPLPLSYLIMEMAGVTNLVVLNAAGGISGMISVTDFVRLSEVTIEDNISKTYSGTDSAADWGWTSKDFLVVTKKLLKLPNVPIEAIMTKNIITVSEVTTVSECIQTLRKNNIDQAPVISATGNLIGMIEDRSLLQLSLEHA